MSKKERRTTRKAIDETGNRYGRLVAIERVGTKVYEGGRTKPIWSCQCDCGNIIEVPSQGLRAGQYKSCGCLKRGPEVENLIGFRRGKLEVISREADTTMANGRVVVWWKCKCDCGNTKVLRHISIKNKSTSCGCSYDLTGPSGRKPRIKHGHCSREGRSPTYESWWSVVQRCTNPTDSAYPLYGGAGVTMVDRWNPRAGGSFENFLKDMGERPDGTSINRIGSVPLYSPETCEWATRSIQSYDQKKRNTNTSGKTGVSFNKNSGKWEAYISVNRKKVNLGSHEKFEDAAKAREEAELKYYGWNKE